MSGAYLDIQRSIQAYLKNFLTRHSLTGFEVFDFDAHASTQELPASDLIGVSDYSIENGKDTHMVTCMITVCTQADDASCTRLRSAIDPLYTELYPGAGAGAPFLVVDAAGLTRGFLTVADNTMVMPVAETKTRPTQSIAVSFGAGYLALPI